MLDLLLIFTLGFLGSFGHCAGMCGPVTVAFSLSQPSTSQPTWQQHIYFHSLLNLGRIISYVLVGAAIGAVGSALMAGGQLAGIDSALRRVIAIVTGSLLIWFGLSQIQPGLLPKLPLLHPLQPGDGHQRLSHAMMRLSLAPHWATPALLGMVWGLIPCGFLYAAQIKAAATGSPWMGAATMLAFGAGTLPVMVGVGVSMARLNADRRSQLFRMGGWVTLAIGILLLLRSSDMVDYTGHAALVCLMLALIARPLSRLWSFPLHYRRALGVGAFVLSIAHVLHMLDHTFNWNVQAIGFTLPLYQWGIWAGILAIVLLTPAAVTSADWIVQAMGQRWRQVHLLTVPALVLCTIHAILAGSSYLGGLQWTATHKIGSVLLGSLTLGALLVRSRWVWSLLSLEQFYGSPTQPKS
ncbi:sulfite exporter TauE/SafE family protein [Pantanalinema rosaneae CENA516]|uniref:urease accessory protein UreH domain-containing protein n=1 Tax=Pantanalinema rosaneae TaxID=1620701 RepID=UPI003D6EEF29